MLDDVGMAGQRRGRMEIIATILQITRNRTKKTSIMVRANLNHKLLQNYLNLLIEKDLLEVSQSKEGHLYHTTSKGHAFNRKYMELQTELIFPRG